MFVLNRSGREGHICPEQESRGSSKGRDVLRAMPYLHLSTSILETIQLLAEKCTCGMTITFGNHGRPDPVSDQRTKGM
jgi:hypothetical protein